MTSKQVLGKLMRSASAKMEDKGQLKTNNPTNPMDFWAKQMKNCETSLAQLAVDVMAIPASSVPSERFFSISGLLVK